MLVMLAHPPHSGIKRDKPRFLRIIKTAEAKKLYMTLFSYLTEF